MRIRSWAIQLVFAVVMMSMKRKCSNEVEIRHFQAAFCLRLGRQIENSNMCGVWLLFFLFGLFHGLSAKENRLHQTGILPDIFIIIKLQLPAPIQPPLFHFVPGTTYRYGVALNASTNGDEARFNLQSKILVESRGVVESLLEDTPLSIGLFSVEVFVNVFGWLLPDWVHESHQLSRVIQ